MKILKAILICVLISFSALSVFALYRSVPFSALMTVDFISVCFLIALIISLIIFLVKHTIKRFRERAFLKYFKEFSLYLIMPVAFCVFIVWPVISINKSENFAYQWNHDVENEQDFPKNRFSKDSMLRGLSVYAMGRQENFGLDQIISSNVEWIAIHPFIYQADRNTAKMSTPETEANWSKKDSAFIKSIELAHRRKLRIMLKPHLWLVKGWRSEIELSDKKSWHRWFDDYEQNMLHYAKMCNIHQVEMFCIGTELRSSLKHLPQRWTQLIDAIREVYSGKITYAFNWNDAILKTNPEFLDRLDLIGIQAYFPLTAKKAPSRDDIREGWLPHLKYLTSINESAGKKILFTEIGYRADHYATVKPWEWYGIFSSLRYRKSEETQLKAYDIFYEKVWHREWFAGAFIWQWNRSRDFSIRNSPAQNCMAKWYNKSVKEI